MWLAKIYNVLVSDKLTANRMRASAAEVYQISCNLISRYNKNWKKVKMAVDFCDYFWVSFIDLRLYSKIP